MSHTFTQRDRPTLSDIIADLQKVVDDHGDLPVATLDDRCGLYPTTFTVMTTDVGGYDEDGFYVAEVNTNVAPGNKICVLGYVP